MSSKIDPRLAAALARGRRVRQKMAKAEGGALSSQQTARLLGISEQAVLNRWRRHELVAWNKGTRVFFPRWQFSNRKVSAGIKQVLKVFRSNDHWRVMGYFLMRRLSLNEETPLALIQRGQTEKVVQHAKAHLMENLW
jgi:hypothetical protein